MQASRIRRAYLEFFQQRGHAVIARANLVPHEDPTTLFTGSGMQPLIPYLLGEPHPAGPRLTDSQVCFRAEDIDEIGDTRHTTMFEMLGNWSLGDYFKAQQLPWVFEFLTSVAGLDPARMFVSVFAGSPRWDIPRDAESEALWGELFSGAGLDGRSVEVGTSRRAAREGTGGAHVVLYDESECWWSRSGGPDTMPPGEPGGSDSEIFYLFPQVEHDPAFGRVCHPYCDCGRYIEVGNSVFMEYRRTGTGFERLPHPNVDFGGGLERIAMASADVGDMFGVDLIAPVMAAIGARSAAGRGDTEADLRASRIIADHTRALVFLALDGVEPSNNTQGYAMRRIIRRAIRQGLHLGIESDLLPALADVVIDGYRDAYPELGAQADRVREVAEREETLFRKTLARGVRELPKLAGDVLDGDTVFTLFDTYGFPPELSVEEAAATRLPVEPSWRQRYQQRMREQRERSRTAAAGLFKGGLADSSQATTRLHTATHLLYKALRLVLGEHVVQRGSNITPQRLRFDFSHQGKLSAEERARVEEIVNANIARDWPMNVSQMSPDEAFAQGRWVPSATATVRWSPSTPPATRTVSGTARRSAAARTSCTPASWAGSGSPRKSRRAPASAASAPPWNERPPPVAVPECETGAERPTCEHRSWPTERGAMPGADSASLRAAGPTVPLNMESARVLAGQAAIIQDLQFVMDCCKRLLAELARPEAERDAVVPQALWSAALVAYARCFGKNKRSGLTTQDVHDLPLHGAVMQYHQWVIKERAKLTNHPANPFDLATVGAALAPPGDGNRRIEGIAILSTSHVLVDDIGVRQLGGLASELAKRTAGKAQTQQDTVLADARKLPLDTLYALPPLTTGPAVTD
jgi:alanyl-tRNA synthetase